jgi:hypothetical protein
MDENFNTVLERKERIHAEPAKFPDAYRTRREAGDYLRSRGYPLSFSTLTKLCALGEGPEPAAWWGSRPLYTDAELDMWAEARSRRRRNARPADGAPDLVSAADDRGGPSAGLPAASPPTPQPKPHAAAAPPPRHRGRPRSRDIHRSAQDAAAR